MKTRDQRHGIVVGNIGRASLVRATTGDGHTVNDTLPPGEHVILIRIAKNRWTFKLTTHAPQRQSR